MADIRQLPLTDQGRKNHDDIFGRKAECMDCGGRFKTKHLINCFYKEDGNHKSKRVCVACYPPYKGECIG